MSNSTFETQKWLTEQQFLNALSFCMLLPGPEAMQLATYAGWRLHGVLGGLIAGLLFVLPGAAIIMVLASLYSSYGDVPLVSALFYGVKAAVLVIVLEALIKVSKKALGEKAYWFIAAFAFVGLFFFSVPYPLIVCDLVSDLALAFRFIRSFGCSRNSYSNRPVFFNVGNCYLRWCLCCISLYGAGCCHAIWLAKRRRND